MNILFAAAALVSAQAAPAAPVDHSQHSAAEHAQHQHAQHQQSPHARRQGKQAQQDGEHKCCKKVNGKMECQMMKGEASKKGQSQHQGHSSH